MKTGATYSNLFGKHVLMHTGGKGCSVGFLTSAVCCSDRSA